jgi:PKD repeat protein
MTRLLHLVLGLALLWGGPALALTGDGSTGAASSLFLAVFDPDAKQSYYKDLGTSMTQFLQNPAASLDLAQDANYAAFLGKPNLIYNVAAFAALKADQSNIATWGYLATSSEGRGIFDRSFVGVDAVRQKMQVYAAYLPGTSGVFAAGDAGYFDGDHWGPSLNGQLGGSSVGRIGASLPFYFVSNATGDAAGGLVRALGAWTLSADGKLGFAPQGNTNVPPVAVAGAAQAVAQGAQVTLDGSASQDPDHAPEALTFAWNQTAGPVVTLAGAYTAKASFAASRPGSYGFRLTVGDGEAASIATTTVTVSVVNQPPLADAGPAQSVIVGTAVVLDGSRSADPDQAPSPLAYQWSVVDAPAATTLSGDKTAKPAFTPTQPGAYRFQLTVSDGAASATATTQVVVSVKKIITIQAPSAWKAKVRQRIGWDPGELRPNRQVKIQFAKNGVKFKNLGASTAKKRGFNWKPTRAQATRNGVLRVCAKPTNGLPLACDSMAVMVLP